jgi:hypothetical protein
MDGTGLHFETMEHGGDIQTRCPRPSSWWTLKAAAASMSRSRKMARLAT